MKQYIYFLVGTIFIFSSHFLSAQGLNLDLSDKTESISLSVHPNPIAIGQTLNISIDGFNNEIKYSDLHLNIYSIIGTKVYSTVISTPLDKKTQNIRLRIDEKFISNIYFISLVSEEIQITKKFLVLS